ncbi:MAG: RAMP superfamily CRISPR-associated protein, partial [Candidatus Heimdallarchaeaceae archaeon]
HPTLHFIPGRTLRGMIGNYLFQQDKNLFTKIAISEEDVNQTKILFKPSLPKNTKIIGKNIRVCKKCKKIVKEQLCPSCKHETTQESGYGNFEVLKKEGRLQKVEVQTTITTHAPISRKTHTTDPEMELKPFNVESILPGTEFDFTIILDNEFTEQIKQIFNEAGTYFGLGGFRSKGYGEVEFTNIEVSSSDNLDFAYYEKGLLIANSEIIFQYDEKQNFIGFQEKIMKKYLQKSYKLLYGQESSQFSLKVFSQQIRESLARGWSISNSSHLDRLEPSIAPGSTCILELQNEKIQKAIQIFGLGEKINMGYGDIYLLEEK